MNKKIVNACLSVFFVSLIFISTHVGSTWYHNYIPKQAYESLKGSLFLENFQIFCLHIHFWLKASPLAFELACLRSPTVYHLSEPWIWFHSTTNNLSTGTTKLNWLYQEKRFIYLTIWKFKEMALPCLHWSYHIMAESNEEIVYRGKQMIISPSKSRENWWNVTWGFITILFGELQRSLMRTTLQSHSDSDLRTSYLASPFSYSNTCLPNLDS